MQAEHNKDMRWYTPRLNFLNLPLSIRARILKDALVEMKASADGAGYVQVPITVSGQSDDPATKVAL